MNHGLARHRCQPLAGTTQLEEGQEVRYCVRVIQKLGEALLEASPGEFVLTQECVGNA
jgi:hypothetical protein